MKKESFSIVKIEEIHWKWQRPDTFPCFICGEKEAVWKVDFRLDGLRGEKDGQFMVCCECRDYDTVKNFAFGK